MRVTESKVIVTETPVIDIWQDCMRGRDNEKGNPGSDSYRYIATALLTVPFSADLPADAHKSKTPSLRMSKHKTEGIAPLFFWLLVEEEGWFNINCLSSVYEAPLSES